MEAKILDYLTARDVFLDLCETLGEESIELKESYGRVLSRDILAKSDVPPFARSPYDGYAFRAVDTIGVSKDHPKTFPIYTEIAAGQHMSQELPEGYAVKILTGAPIPLGATAVIKFEDTDFTDQNVTIFQQCKENENVVPSGEDVQAGSIIVKAGERIGAPEHALIAGQGIESVFVYRRPHVAVISLGDELLEVGQPMALGKIYNTNRYMLDGTLRKEGIDVTYLGSLDDDLNLIANVFVEASKNYDMIITTGGASVGDYDFSKKAIELAGGELHIQKVRMKPGSSCGMGKINGTPIACLSGNPAAAMTTFHMVAMPGIRKMAGLGNPYPTEIQVELQDGFSKKSPNTRFLKGTLDLSDGRVVMKISVAQGNGMVSSMKDVDVFAVIPAGSGPVEKGAKLKAYII